MSEGTALIEAIETYYDAVPRAGAVAEAVGPFTLFVGSGAWAYYARPTLRQHHDLPAATPAADMTADDVRALLSRQRELDVSQEIEWQPSVAPSLEAACLAAGMTVYRYRLLVHDGSKPAAGTLKADGAVAIVHPDDDLRSWLSAQQLGFGAPAEVDANTVEHIARRVKAGTSRAAAAVVNGRPVCVGMHQPVGDVSEIVGVATVPEWRCQGWATRLTSALVDDAAALGVHTVFLSAADDAVARVYERVGFRDVGIVCAASA